MKRILSAIFFVFILSFIGSSVTFAQGTNLASGTPVSTEIKSASTTHTYQFTTNKDGEAYITLDQTTAGFSMYLYDSNNKLINVDYWASGGKTIAFKDKLKKGTYTIKVAPYYWGGSVSSGKYRVKATYASTFVRNETTFEPNDTDNTSMNIKSGKTYSSTADSVVDRDVYQFTTNKDGEIYVTLDQITAPFKMSLVDANGQTIDYDFTHSGREFLVISELLPKGTYYVYIDSYFWDWEGVTSGKYRLRATYPGSFTRNSTTLEPNDTMETSVPMVSNKTYNSSSFSFIDQDVYQFTNSKSGNVTVVLDKTTGGFEMYLIDSQGGIIRYNYWTSPGKTIEFDVELEKGTYYIYVVPDGWNGITSANYRLKATFQDHTPTINPLYNTGKTITGNATSNTTVVASVGTKKIGEAVAKDGKYSIAISPQPKGTKISVYAVNKSGVKSGTKSTTVVDAALKTSSVRYDKIKVSWSKVPGVHGYEIYRSTSSTGTFSKVGTVTDGSTLTYTNTGVTTGKTYHYKVRAYRTVNGKKVYSPYTKTKSGKAIPSKPSNVSAKKVNSSTATVSWSKIAGANGYQVYRSSSKDGTYTLVGTVKKGSTVSYTNKNLSSGKTYYYKVRAFRTVNNKRVYGNYSTPYKYKH